MQVHLPYIRPQMMNPEARKVPLMPFLLSFKDYSVLTGDMIRALGMPDQDKKRPEGFGIQTRYSSPRMNTTPHDEVTALFGGPYKYDAGMEAANFLRKWAKHRDILMIPAISDDKTMVLKARSGKIICDAYLSGIEGGGFDIENNISLHKLMRDYNHAMTKNGYEPPDAKAGIQRFPGGITRSGFGQNPAKARPSTMGFS